MTASPLTESGFHSSSNPANLTDYTADETQPLNLIPKQEESTKHDLSLLRRITVVAVVATLAAFEGLCMSLPGPFFPAQAKDHGLSQSQIGIVTGSLEFSCLFASFIVGSLTTPKSTNFVSISGTFLCSFAIASFGLLNFMPASRLYFALCILARAINGVGVAMTYAMLTPIPLKCFPEQAGLMAAIIDTTFALGMFSGPIIGSVLIVFGGYHAAFLFAGGMEAIFSFFAVFVFPAASNSSKNRKQSSNCGDYLKFLGSFPAVSAIIPSIVVFFISGFRDAAFSLHFHDAIGIQLDHMGFVFIATPIATGVTAAVGGIIVDQGYGIFLNIFSEVLIPITTFAMFLPYFVPELETTGWAMISLAVSGMSLAGIINPFHLIIQKIALKRGATSIDQVRTDASFSFIIMMSSGRILGATVFGGFLNESLGFYFTSLIYSIIAIITTSWHVLFLFQNGLLGRIYYPTSL